MMDNAWKVGREDNEILMRSIIIMNEGNKRISGVKDTFTPAWLYDTLLKNRTDDLARIHRILDDEEARLTHQLNISKSGELIGLIREYQGSLATIRKIREMIGAKQKGGRGEV